MKNLLLDVKNLDVSYGSGENLIQAVQSLSFQLHKGETIGIVGESGSGKSTSALAIMGLLPESALCNSEKIEFYNQQNIAIDITGRAIQSFRGRELAMIFQDPSTSLNPVKRCGEQVSEVLRIHLNQNYKEARKNSLRLLDDAGLPNAPEISEAYPHELSGGQKQRVMIAMAMACKPSLLFADEPTTSLDVTVQSTILDLLKRLKEQTQMGMIFISHDMAVVSKIADRVIVMQNGKLIEEGTCKELFTNPKQSYTKGLLACRPPLNERIEKLPTVDEYIELAKLNKTPERQLVNADARKRRHNEMYDHSPILSVNSLSTSYNKRSSFFSFGRKKKQILFDINLDLFKGETLGLVGESGSGKTTLGKALLQLLPVDSGTVIYLDKDLTTIKSSELRAIRKDLQMVFQDPFSSLDPRKTIAESLLEPMRAQKVLKTDKERLFFIGGILQKVNIHASALKRYPHEFSGGQRQRIGIARALTLSPRCIIFDEPVSSLDVSVQAQVLNLINELKQDLGFSCIFISHDLSVVKYMSDRIVVLEKGHIVEVGEADELFSNPSHPYTQRLIAAIPNTDF